MTIPLKFKNAREYAVKLLSIRAYTCFEIRQKLHRQGFTEQEIEQTIQYLNYYHYIDDRNLCFRTYENLVAAGKYGKKAIVQKLQQKGITRELIFEAATVNDYDEISAAKTLIDKKFGLPLSADKLPKAARYLNTRGFSYDTIKNVLAIES